MDNGGWGGFVVLHTTTSRLATRLHTRHKVQRMTLNGYHQIILKYYPAPFCSPLVTRPTALDVKESTSIQLVLVYLFPRSDLWWTKKKERFM